MESLERIYPPDGTRLREDEQGAWDTHWARHVRRYERVLELLGKYAPPSDCPTIADIGSGSGYGVEILGRQYRVVLGVEPDLRARSFASKAYPAFYFSKDLNRRVEVGVFVESMEHMTHKEFGDYLEKIRNLVVVTTPLVLFGFNEHHKTEFKRYEDVRDYMVSHRLKELYSETKGPIRFTTGEVGYQYIGVWEK